MQIFETSWRYCDLNRILRPAIGRCRRLPYFRSREVREWTVWSCGSIPRLSPGPAILRASCSARQMACGSCRKSSSARREFGQRHRNLPDNHAKESAFADFEGVLAGCGRIELRFDVGDALIVEMH